MTDLKLTAILSYIMKKAAFVILLILFLLIGNYLLKENPLPRAISIPDSNPTSNISAWKTYKNPVPNFSVKYPSDILYPDFNDIDSNSPDNKKLAISVPGINLYRNDAYIARGFDSGPELNVGFLKPKPESSYITKKYYGINFIVYYFPKDIKSLKEYFGSNKDFYFSKINNQTVAVLDHTKEIDGEPPSWAKFYFIKFGDNLLKIGTFIPAEFATKEDKIRVFELFEKVSKTVSF